MRLTFQLRYHTSPGQSLWIIGNHELLGADDPARARPMEYQDQDFWRIQLDPPKESLPNTDITYRYILRTEDGSEIEDRGRGRSLSPTDFETADLLVIDSWNHPGFYENAFYTEPFQQVLLRARQSEIKVPSPALVTHTFKVRAPLLEQNQTLCVLGNTPALGNWDTSQPFILSRTIGQEWLTAQLDLTHERFPIEYKYGLYDLVRKTFVVYEGGANRTLQDSVAPGKRTVVNDGFAVFPADTWKGAGVAIPVFSLRSQSSFGVGEFTDLEVLADWCQAVGLKLIQILPVNDTSATHTSADSYPYAAISAFALHPLYLNLTRVATPANRSLVQGEEEERKRLNALKDLDYEGVMRKKRFLAETLYRRQKDRTFKSKEYKNFFTSNQHWLVPYALFCYFRDQNGTPEFSRWKEHQRYDAQELAPLLQKDSPAWDSLALDFFIQFHLDAQLRAATEYAHRKGVILKGDIAIGVSRNGADAWQQPEIYRMEMQAGAPPDAFGIKGQNWSFPTYNWARMRETGFAWWKQRFTQMGYFFDAFRIDHVLGFFRIWSIPLHAVEGILGHFVPAIPVNVREFSQRNIPFDHDRYTKPYISDAILTEVFGAAAESVKAQFLQPPSCGTFQLKPEFTTQRQVQSYFAQQAPTAANQKLEEGLFDLISNVILLADETSPSKEFHFRFSIESTLSFKNLDARTQEQLRELYLDYFFRRQDQSWRQQGMQKLPALRRVTNMLVCGEDLGMVPACVPETMKQLGLLSLEVQRMPKRLDQQFSNPKDAPYLSVVTPGTHDMSTVRAWWKEDRAVTQSFYNVALGLSGPAPEECEPWICRAIIRQHLDSPAMWSIFQLQDLLGLDPHLRRPNPAEERINVPADAKNYWKYRLHLWLEDLLQAQAYNGQLKTELTQSGRST